MKVDGKTWELVHKHKQDKPVLRLVKNGKIKEMEVSKEVAYNIIQFYE